VLQLKTSLQNGEVIMVPPIKEATKLLTTFIRNVGESSRSFVRWMDGTCIEMPDQRPKGDTDGEPLVMHFNSEVVRMQQVRAPPLMLEHRTASASWFAGVVAACLCWGCCQCITRCRL
jgi:dynein heavy chain